MQHVARLHTSYLSV